MTVERFLKKANKGFKLGDQTDYGIVQGKEIVGNKLLVTFDNGNKVIFQGDGWDNLVEIGLIEAVVTQA